MQTSLSFRHPLQRLVLALAFAGLTFGCDAVPERHTQPGELELAVVGVTDQGARYRVHGSFDLSGLDNGVFTRVASEENPTGAVVRRLLPPGLYSVTLNPGFTLEALTTGSDSPSPDAASIGVEAPSADAPQLVLVQSDQLARVSIQSTSAGARGEHPLARAE
jgi:hypothetical protein